MNTANLYGMVVARDRSVCDEDNIIINEYKPKNIYIERDIDMLCSNSIMMDVCVFFQVTYFCVTQPLCAAKNSLYPTTLHYTSYWRGFLLLFPPTFHI